MCPVALSPTDFTPYCTSLLGVLFSVRSRYLFAIGLEECLVFPVDAWGLHEEYPIPDTLELTRPLLVDSTGLSPCFVLCSKRLRVEFRGVIVSPNTTLPIEASVWTVSRSLAVTNDITLRFLFLPILRCFSSRRSPLREAIAVGIPIRKSCVLPLRAGPTGFSQLGTSFFSSQAERSTSWHSSHVHRIGVATKSQRITLHQRCNASDPGTGPVDAWTTRTHGLICTPVDGWPALTLPTRVYTGWCIGCVRIESSAVSHLRDTIRDSLRDMDPLGFEPRASSLQRRHSPTELWAHPSRSFECERELGVSLDSSKVPDRPLGAVDRTWNRKVGRGNAPVPVSGGDPAADSPTATLLRLKPPCGAQIRPPEGGLIRTPLGCFDGRCVQGAGTYSPPSSERRLLPNPASCRRVSACNPNYDRVSEISAPSRGCIPLSRPL